MRPKCIEIMITTYYIKTNPVFWLATREGKMAYVARVIGIARLDTAQERQQR